MRYAMLLTAVLAGAALAGRSPDSLYFKAYDENQLFRTDKEGRGLVRDGVTFSWLDHNTGPAMDPAGEYLYEAHENTLRRHNALTGSHTNYQLESRSYSMSCGTDGEHLYYRGQNSWRFIKATLTGALVSVNTTQQYIGVSHGLGVGRDTFWIAHGDYTPITYRGYPLSECNGDSTLYNHGELYIPLSALGTPGPVTWDGTHFFSACGWAPGVPSPFMRWDAEHNYLDTVLLAIDVRSVMVPTPGTGAREEPAAPVARAFIELGPNPVVGGRATLRYGLPKAGPARVSVFDITGREVLRLTTAGNRQSTMPLDLRSLSAGIYLLKLEADGFSATRKLVVQQ